MCGVRGIALSFAFFTRKEGPELVRQACEHGARIVERLCADWKAPALEPRGEGSSAEDVPDLFSVNVPLVEGVGERPVRWTWMLDNKWPTGSLYKELDAGDAGGKGPETGKAPSFRWAPSFADMWRIVDESPAGNDGLTVRNGETSVTPLRANFMELYGRGEYTGEFKL